MYKYINLWSRGSLRRKARKSMALSPERKANEFKRAIWMLENQINSPADLIKFWCLFPYRRKS